MIEILAALAISHHDDLKKRMNRITATWRNGCFGKMDNHLVHTIPNYYSKKMDILPKTLAQIILAAKWLVRHSSMSPQPTATTFTFSSVTILLLCSLVRLPAKFTIFKQFKDQKKKFPDWHVFTSCTCEQHSCHTAARKLLIPPFSTAWPAAGAHRRRTRPGHQLERTGQPRSSPVRMRNF